MPVRKVAFVPGEFYHLYNRGNSRQEIFRDHSDYHRFLQLLYLANGTCSLDVRSIPAVDRYSFDRGEPLVAIGAYCLMPNHFHLLVTPLVDDGVTVFMRKLTTSYSMYFNKRHYRTGSLFEGRYKSEHAADDRYLKYLFAYIHLNPVKLIQPDWQEKGIADLNTAVSFLSAYEYSSYQDTLSDRSQGVIRDITMFPVYFATSNDHTTELAEWLSFTKDGPS